MVDKSEKFTWLVRAGYFSRAIMYSVLGLIALTSAGKISQGTDGIFRAIENFPFGVAILWLMVVGLTGYAVFRFASTFFDIENEGSDAMGWGKRLGHAGSAIGHLALAYSAYKFASSDISASSDGGGAQEAASGILSVEFGGIVLGLLGVAFFLAAINQAKKAWTSSFMNRIGGGAPQYTRLLGQIGYLARTIVFIIIGWSVIQAGLLSGGGEQVKTLGDALASLADDGVIFQLVALGLLVFGLFSFILARYRIIPDLDAAGKIPSFRA